MTKSKKQKKAENPEFAKCIGKHTILRLSWKPWTELPHPWQQIYIVLKLKDGYFPVTGMFCDETLPANGPFKESRWQSVKFDEAGLGELFLHDKKAFKLLIAWAQPKAKVLLTETP
jgi:hypothetical protein